MLLNRAEKLAVIHVARKDRGLDDEAYRALLSGAAGVSSASEIETEAQFEEVMRGFAALGFVRKPVGSSHAKGAAPRAGSAPGQATERQLYYIRGLWALASEKKDEGSLRAMVRRIGKVDDIRFLTRGAASGLILALRDICEKAGFNPDGPAPRVRTGTEGGEA